MTGRRPLLAATMLAALIGIQPAGATSLDARTFRASLPLAGASANGPSTRPSLSPDGRFVAFESIAANLVTDFNGPVRDVFVNDLVTGRLRLVSEAAGGGGADGPSSAPVIASDVVAFSSQATNLVSGDGNAARDIFVRTGSAPAARVSLAPAGREANGDSTEPDISADGRVIAFTSAATNLAPEDSNATSDVFVADLATGAVQRASSVGARSAGGRSRQPAISATGRFVTFASTAADLVPGDTNDVEDVFVFDRLTGVVERVSVGVGGAEQNRAVEPPFSIVSDVSSDGRFVTFDSDASNLVPGDRNEDTDVFQRDRHERTTRRVSLDSFEREGDNDSYFPSMSASGRWVAFSSFAGNLAPDDHPKEDVFVRDTRRGTTSVVNVTASGGRRGEETVAQLLQRPAISDQAAVVAFSSSAANLVAGDDNRLEDVFVRITAPPRTRFTRRPKAVERTSRPRYVLDVDDRAANRLLCTIDGVSFICARSGRVPEVGNGSHTLRVRAGGPGMLFEDPGATARFRVTGIRNGPRRPQIRPTVRISQPSSRRFRDRIQGSSSGGAGVVRVEVLAAVARNGRCHYWDGTDWTLRACDQPLSVVAEGTSNWRLILTKSAPPGRVSVRARAIDGAGNRSRDVFRFAISR